MPSDLNLKKSWNPALVKNQAKVWAREQESLQEYKKIKEREEEVKKERERMDLLKLQYPDGIPEHKLNKMSWMYEGPGGSSEITKEGTVSEATQDFLLGRKRIEDALNGNGVIVAREEKKTRLEKALEGGSELDEKQVEKRAKEDPLLMIKNEEIRKLKQRMSSSKQEDSGHGSRSHRSSSSHQDSRRYHERSHRDSRDRTSSRRDEDGHRSRGDREYKYDDKYRSRDHRDAYQGDRKRYHEDKKDDRSQDKERDDRYQDKERYRDDRYQDKERYRDDRYQDKDRYQDDRSQDKDRYQDRERYDKERYQDIYRGSGKSSREYDRSDRYRSSRDNRDKDDQRERRLRGESADDDKTSRRALDKQDRDNDDKTVPQQQEAALMRPKDRKRAHEIDF